MLSVILAAGKLDYTNKGQGLTSSQHLTLVNGRPAISWVVRDVLKQTDDKIIISINENDCDLKQFILAHYRANPRIILCEIPVGFNIVESLRCALYAGCGDFDCTYVRVLLGDTLLLDVPYGSSDSVYLSKFDFYSRSWCVTSPQQDGTLSYFVDKSDGFGASEFLAVVGRYEFSDIKILRRSVNNALAKEKREISDVLLEYMFFTPLHAIEISKDQWIDFGHLEGLISARSKLIESRSFNKLWIDPLLPEIIKSSSNYQKLQHEIAWYRLLPSRFQSLAPRVLSSSKQSITMEYYGYGTLAEKFLYANLSVNFWADVLFRLFSIVNLFREECCETEVFCTETLYLDKTKQRLQRLKENDFWNDLIDTEFIYINGKKYSGIVLLVDRILDQCSEISKCPSRSIVHGDLCFNNILFDINSGVIKLIDPRGSLEGGGATIFGDSRYDIAKIRHSFCGNYDSIVEGDFCVEKISQDEFSFCIFKENQSEREKIFNDTCQRFGYNISEICFIESLLFFTMIPLHADFFKKQLAFFLSAVQKFNQFFGGLDADLH